jgi:tetratricopeptide (TPR) repeat protein
MKVLHLIPALASLAFVACNVLSPSRMGRPTDPDAEVARITAEWDRATGGLSSEHYGPLEPDESRSETMGRLLDQAEFVALEHPRHLPVLTLCAALCLELRRPDDAVAYLDMARDVDPACAEAAVLRSRIALEQGNHPFALRLLDEQAVLHPDRHEVFEARAAVFFLTGRSGEALQDLTVAGKLGAPAWRIAYNRGLVAEFQRRPDVASVHYAECLKLNPGFEPARARQRGVETPIPASRN